MCVWVGKSISTGIIITHVHYICVDVYDLWMCWVNLLVHKCTYTHVHYICVDVYDLWMCWVNLLCQEHSIISISLHQSLQGVQAQTVANFLLAFEANLSILPVINKVGSE